tara:strand:+ start:2023 stop:2871 length:849 start_codon:yes stop_codon:yes gene_type:complete
VFQFIRITSSELLRMFARKRTYGGYAAFLAFNLLFLAILSRPGPSKLFRKPMENGGFAFEEYYSALTLAFAILGLTTIFLLIPFLALVAGDVVSKELEDGNLRLILSRPVSRARLLLSKFLACHIYTFTLVAFLALISFGTGALLTTWNGSMFVMTRPREVLGVFDFETGLRRYLISAGFLTLCMSTISSVAFLFSCQNLKPAAATILTICVFFIDRILWGVPYFQDYQNWFLTPHLRVWIQAFADPLPWGKLGWHLGILVGISIGCFAVGWLTFRKRDLKA